MVRVQAVRDWRQFHVPSADLHRSMAGTTALIWAPRFGPCARMDALATGPSTQSLPARGVAGEFARLEVIPHPDPVSCR